MKDLKKERLKRIEERKKVIKPKKERKMMKYSDNYTLMFNFFLKSYRADILTFCGSEVKVIYDKNGDDGKFSFRRFENGDFKNSLPTSSQPNILKAVIIAKKSWGLFCKEWSLGISDGLFTKQEIIDEFTNKGITVPDVFMKEFDNKIYSLKYAL